MAAAKRPVRIDIANLKSGGFIRQRQRDLYTVRVRTPMGRITPDRLRVIADCAERFGSGVVHFSIRQTPEIVGVPFHKFDELVEALAAGGLKPASCGPRVRAVSGCSGCEINPNGLVDTQRLGLETDERFFGRPCHAKFKITFSGCPIDCTRAKCADLGFTGMAKPELKSDLCTACGVCVAVCKEKALVEDQAGKPVRDDSRCIGCGDCVKVCPTDAMYNAKVGLAVYAGGKHGRHPRTADHVADLLPEELMPEVIEKTIEWYLAAGKKGERLGHVIERTGVEAYKAAAIPREFRLPPGAGRQTGRMVD